MSFFSLLGVIFSTWIATALFAMVAREIESWQRIALLAALGLALLWSPSTGLRALIRYKRAIADGNPIELGKAYRASGQRAGIAGGTGIAALGGSALASIFITIGSVFIVGWMIALRMSCSSG
jgi:hypothetical protein